MQGTTYSAGPGLVPSVAMTAALWGVILDAEQVLAGDAPDAVKVAAIAGCIAERVPGHQGGIAAGATVDEVAALIAARLIGTADPATAVFARLLRREIRLHVIGPHVRDAGDAERAVLRLHPAARLYVREGYLLAGTIQCAKVTLKISPDRVIRGASRTACPGPGGRWRSAPATSARCAPARCCAWARRRPGSPPRRSRTRCARGWRISPADLPWRVPSRPGGCPGPR